MVSEMKKNINKLLLIVLFWFYCSNIIFGKEAIIGKIKENSNQMVLNISNLELVEMNYSDFFSEVEFVPLETTKNSMIGEIFTVRMYADTLFVFDQNIAKTLFLFTRDGKFIRKIGNLGKGPGEYIYPTDFNVNLKNRTVSFLARNSNKIIFHNFEGEHIKDIKLQDDFICEFTTVPLKYKKVH